MLSAEHTCDSDRVFALPYFDFLELLNVRVCVCVHVGSVGSVSSVSTVCLGRNEMYIYKKHTLCMWYVIGCLYTQNVSYLHSTRCYMYRSVTAFIPFAHLFFIPIHLKVTVLDMYNLLRRGINLTERSFFNLQVWLI